ncbi:MAG: CDGSH iron-sulfur domain-containing protein [Acidobacteriota bacterium]
MGRHSYPGEKLTVHYDNRTCLHAGECVRGLPAVFNPKNRPWVDADAAAADALAEVITRCPTGALTYERADGGRAEAAPPENTVRVEANGPVYLAGDLRITGANGDTVTRTRAALCRCGASHVKPFCDGSHGKAEYADTGEIGDVNAKAAPGGQSHLDVQVLENGPVVLGGPFRLVDAHGETRAEEAGSGALCRCGRSVNTPFCDGSHKPSGFSDPGAIAD